MSGVEAELREIKDTIRELNKKLNVLLDESEVLAITSLSEKSLSEFLSEEPELYTLRDVKARYK